MRKETALKLPASPGSQSFGKEDRRILAGLSVLYSTIDVPTGLWDKPVPPQGKYPVQDIYFLWSLERVGMLFNLPTLGDKEWYRWGAEVLVTNQLKSGEFNAADWSETYSRTSRGSTYGPILKTALSLLFLKYSHPMKDLTAKLPFKPGELNESIMALFTTPAPISPSSPSQDSKGRRPSVPPP
jgi:hypothetical protein